MPAASAFQIGFEVKKMFIRDKALMSKFERSRNAALRRFGTIVKREARKSLKRKGNKNRIRRTGPPVMWSPHTENLRSIFYGTEKSGRDLTVVIGPVAFNGRRPTIPETLEHGLKGYRERAFMAPALEKKYDQLLESLLKFGVV